MSEVQDKTSWIPLRILTCITWKDPGVENGANGLLGAGGGEVGLIDVGGGDGVLIEADLGNLKLCPKFFLPEPKFWKKNDPLFPPL